MPQLTIVMKPATYDIAKIALITKTVGKFDVGSALASFTVVVSAGGYQVTLTTSNSRIYEYEANAGDSLESVSTTGIFTLDEVSIIQRLIKEVGFLLEDGLTELTYTYVYV